MTSPEKIVFQQDQSKTNDPEILEFEVAARQVYVHQENRFSAGMNCLGKKDVQRLVAFLQAVLDNDLIDDESYLGQSDET